MKRIPKCPDLFVWLAVIVVAIELAVGLLKAGGAR